MDENVETNGKKNETDETGKWLLTPPGLKDQGLLSWLVKILKIFNSSAEEITHLVWIDPSWGGGGEVYQRQPWVSWNRRSRKIRKLAQFIQSSLSETMTHELNPPLSNMSWEILSRWIIGTYWRKKKESECSAVQIGTRRSTETDGNPSAQWPCQTQQ